MATSEMQAGAESDDDFFTAEELADWLRVGVSTVWEWEAKGTGPISHKLSRRRLWRRGDVREWLANQRSGPATALSA